jgi:hypothetical protein
MNGIKQFGRLTIFVAEPLRVGRVGLGRDEAGQTGRSLQKTPEHSVRSESESSPSTNGVRSSCVRQVRQWFNFIRARHEGPAFESQNFAKYFPLLLPDPDEIHTQNKEVRPEPYEKISENVTPRGRLRPPRKWVSNATETSRRIAACTGLTRERHQFAAMALSLLSAR